MHEFGRELSGDRRPALVGHLPPLGREVRRGLQPGVPRRAGRHARGPRPAGDQAAELCLRGAAVRRGQRERGPGQYRLCPGEHSLAAAGPGGRLSAAGGSKFSRFAPSPRQAHCFFEWIYFANVASTMDGRSVYLSRKALGEELARLETVPIDEDTIVVPVPDTSKAAADAMAFSSRSPALEGLIRNRYSGRTFIEGSGNRKHKAEIKYTPLREVLEGKRVLLVEDSIVRSTTMKVLLQRIRWQGPAKRDPRPRGLPADHLALLLRHRHVDVQRAVRPAVPAGPAADRRNPGGNGRHARRRFAPLSCRSRRSPGRLGSGPTNCARPASPGSIPRPAARSWPRWRPRTKRAKRRCAARTSG